MTASVVIVTGPPGAGKTTTARLLANAYERSVHLHADDFWQFIVRGWIEPWTPESREQNETVIKVATRAAAHYAAGGYQVVLDGIFGPWFFELLLEASESLAVPFHYLVLRPDEETTVRRATDRVAPAMTDESVVRLMHRQFADLGRFESHVIDNSKLDAEQAMRLCHAGVAGGGYRLPGGV